MLAILSAVLDDLPAHPAEARGGRMNAKGKRTLWWLAGPVAAGDRDPVPVRGDAVYRAQAGRRGVRLPGALAAEPLALARISSTCGRAANFGAALRKQPGDQLPVHRAGARGQPARRLRAGAPAVSAGRGAYRQFLLLTQMLSPILLVVGLFRLAAMIPYGDGNLVDSKIGVIVSYAAFNIAFAGLDAVLVLRDGAARSRGIGLAGGLRCAARRVLKVFLPLTVPGDGGWPRSSPSSMPGTSSPWSTR